MEVDRIDVAVLAEELAEIYSTPTPKGGRSRKSKLLVYWIDWFFLQWPRLDIYTESLNMNPTRARFVTIFGINENIPNLR